MNKDIKVGKAICRLPSLVSPAPSPHPLMSLVTGSAVRWRRIPPALSHTPSPCSLALILYRAYHITLFFPLIHANSADISSANTNTLKAEQSSFTSAEWVFSAAERIPPASLVMAPRASNEHSQEFVSVCWSSIREWQQRSEWVLTVRVTRSPAENKQTNCLKVRGDAPCIIQRCRL